MLKRAQVAASRLEAPIMLRLFWLCLACLLAGCGGALEPRAPDPEYGRSVAKEFEVAFNGGWSEMDGFERRHWVEPALAPTDERRNRYVTRQRGMGRIRLQQVALEGDQMVALTQTEFGDWLKCCSFTTVRCEQQTSWRDCRRAPSRNRAQPHPPPSALVEGRCRDTSHSYEG
jgi:hypothetical protein